MVLAMSSLAYNTPTHEDLSREAAQRSKLAGPGSSVLRDLGLSGGETFDNGRGARTIIQLIQDGSVFQDNGVRAINHFYDPVDNTGLLPAFAQPSPDWTLESRGSIVFPLVQRYSFSDGRDYLYKALISTDKAERERNFGLTFETVGHLIHHMQDMAQPQHVRLDSHLKISEAGSPDWFFENHSRYELYTQRKRDDLPFAPDPRYSWALSQLPPVGNAREFWARGARGGMALFTNKNFVSAGTNFMVDRNSVAPNARYPEPVPTFVSAPVSVKQLYAEENKPYPPQLQAECEGRGRDCRMAFVSTTVQETDPDFSGINSRAATYSVFDQDLGLYNAKVTYVDRDTGQQVISGRAFSLNEFNFDEAHKFLIPRAVAYSAAMIDYFFRGKVELEEDLSNLGRFALRNKHASEAMSGDVSLYYDQDDATRQPLPGFNLSASVAADGEASLVLPEAPFKEAVERLDNETYMLVFKGTLGEEAPSGDSPGAVIGKQVKIRNIFRIIDTEYRPWSNYPGGYMQVRFDWNGDGRAELRQALQDAMRSATVEVNGHVLTTFATRSGMLGYADTDDFYAQLEVSTDWFSNYLYLQNVGTTGTIELKIDGRVVSGFDWEKSRFGNFVVISKAFRAYQR